MKMIKKLKLYSSMIGYARAHNRDFAREHWEFFSAMRNYLAPRGGIAGKKALDVGCGKSAWLTILLAGAGADAQGVDTEVVRFGFSIRKYAGLLSNNGLERTARTLFWEFFYARPYFAELARHADFPLDLTAAKTSSMSILDTGLADSSFDLAVSYEVLEHIEDIEAAAAEMARILKPCGLTYLYVHNYTSISGGHHIAWKYPETEPSRVVPPWDHLRENRFPMIPSWINRKREQEYRQGFEKHFDILDWMPTVKEGCSMLTPQIRQELSGYSEDELLTKGFIIVGRPKQPGTPFV